MAAEIIHGAAAVVLATLRPQIADMIYMDPPFGTGLVWTGDAGSFSDRFTWDAEKFAAVVGQRPLFGDYIEAVVINAGRKAYLVMMAELLIASRRALKYPGSLWLHCDDTMSHYLRVVGDIIFGPDAFLGQLIWRRSSAHSSGTRSYGRVHDTILVFARTRAARWRLSRIRSEFLHGDPCSGTFVDGLLEGTINASSKERVGYPTQKPVALLERIVRAGCPIGGTVLDPTCGSGTTLVAARNCGMESIGIDLSPDAVALSRSRLAPSTKRRAPALPLFGEAA